MKGIAGPLLVVAGVVSMGLAVGTTNPMSNDGSSLFAAFPVDNAVWMLVAGIAIGLGLRLRAGGAIAGLSPRRGQEPGGARSPASARAATRSGDGRRASPEPSDGR